MAIIVLLYKKGDLQLLGNYHPISLTNADYKILIYILSNHLSVHLTNIIVVNQTAYMSGRFIGTNICTVQDAINHFALHCLSSAVLFLDFRKAFDSVLHQFLFSLLYRIGLPSDYITWIKIMYNNMYSSVRFKNWLTPQIQLQQGVQQGCPLSCHLFNLVGQVLVFHLRDHGFFDWWKQHGDPCSLYADNTTIFIESLSQLATLIVEIQCVGHFTGLHLNLNKTIVLSLHDKPQRYQVCRWIINP